MEGPPIWQRLLAALAYLLPWSDSIGFGGSLFRMFPVLQYLQLPALPLLLLEQAVPFGGLVLFLVLFVAVVRNPKVPYMVRFNVLQAILIDIVLVLLQLAFQILLSPLGGGFVTRTLSNTIFLGAMLLVVFAIVQCLRGKEADIPTVSEAVRMQIQ
jgi:uncharacterized membrane protein